MKISLALVVFTLSATFLFSQEWDSETLSFKKQNKDRQFELIGPELNIRLDGFYSKPGKKSTRRKQLLLNEEEFILFFKKQIINIKDSARANILVSDKFRKNVYITGGEKFHMKRMTWAKRKLELYNDQNERIITSQLRNKTVKVIIHKKLKKEEEVLIALCFEEMMILQHELDPNFGEWALLTYLLL